MDPTLILLLVFITAAAVALIHFRPGWLTVLLRSELGALTLSEADKYSTNQVAVGVAELSADQNPLLALMPFVPIRGNAYQYQRQSATSAPTFIAPNGTVTEGVPTTTQVVTSLKILIGDADIDKFLRITRSKDQDVEAQLLNLKALDFADKWGDAAIYGSIDADANEFDGLHEIAADDLAAGQTINLSADATPDAGSFSQLDALIDLCRGRNRVLLMSRRSRRQIQKLSRSQGWDLALSTLGSLSKPVQFYNDIPILVCDFLTDTETLTAGGLFSSKTGSTGSSIFCVDLSEDSLHGISADDPDAQDDLERIIQLEKVGTLETKDANRWRVKAYTAIVSRKTQGLSRLTGIGAADWTN